MERCEQNKIAVREVRVVRIGMIKGKESPANGGGALLRRRGIHWLPMKMFDD